MLHLWNRILTRNKISRVATPFLNLNCIGAICSSVAVYTVWLHALLISIIMEYRITFEELDDLLDGGFTFDLCHRRF